MTKSLIAKPAKSVATDPGVLKDLAHKITVSMKKSDDHRVTAACYLAEAKAVCKVAKRSFKDWVARDLRAEDGARLLGYTEAVRLSKAGASPDPAKAIADMRAGGAAREAKRRAKVASRDATPEAVAPGPDAHEPTMDEALALLITAIEREAPTDVGPVFKRFQRDILSALTKVANGSARDVDPLKEVGRTVTAAFRGLGS